MKKYLVKVLENFRDGMLFPGRILKAGEVLVLTETEYRQAVESGAVFDNPTEEDMKEAEPKDVKA